MVEIIFPHILLKKWDVIVIPWEVADHIVLVEGLINWYLLCSAWNNRFVIPRGFYFKDDLWLYHPII